MQLKGSNSTKGFLYVASLLFLFLGSSALPFFSYAESPPNGIVAYVPITITNSQNSSAPAGFQQEVNVNWQSYSPYPNSACSNVGFFTSSWTPINAWMQNASSSCSSDQNDVVWLALPDGVGAFSNVTVYLGFYSTFTNNFNSAGPWGEAAYIYDSSANYTTAYEVPKMGYYGIAFEPSTTYISIGPVIVNPFGNGTNYQIIGETNTEPKWSDFLLKSSGMFQWTQVGSGPIISSLSLPPSKRSYDFPYIASEVTLTNGTFLIYGHLTNTNSVGCSGTATTVNCEVVAFRSQNLVTWTWEGDVGGVNGTYLSNPGVVYVGGRYYLTMTNNTSTNTVAQRNIVEYQSSNPLSGFTFVQTVVSNAICTSRSIAYCSSGGSWDGGAFYYDSSTATFYSFFTANNGGHFLSYAYTKNPRGTFTISPAYIYQPTGTLGGRTHFAWVGNTAYLFYDNEPGPESLVWYHSYNNVDDGAQVFDFYTNFTSSGTWTTSTISTNTYSARIDNGLLLNSQDSLVPYAYHSYTPSSEEQSDGLYLDIGGQINNITTTTGGSALFGILGSGATDNSTSSEAGYEVRMFASGNMQDNIARITNGTSTTLISSSDSGTNYEVFRLMFGWSGTTLQANFNDKISLSTTDSTYSLSSSVSQIIIGAGASPSGGASDFSTIVFWTDTRIYPPNNVMPSASFGSLQRNHHHF